MELLTATIDGRNKETIVALAALWLSNTPSPTHAVVRKQPHGGYTAMLGSGEDTLADSSTP